MYIPFETYIGAMDLSDDEISQIDSILQHVMFGMDSERLIENFEYGNLPKKPKYKELAHGIVYQPSVRGVELFLRAHGLQSPASRQLLSEDLDLSLKNQIMIPPGFRAVTLP
jgi:hypothetical protein